MSEDDYKKIFVKKLKYYMEINGKNQMDLMNDLGLSSSTVSSWCTGIKLPRMGKIQMLADYFKINKSDLIEDKPTSFSQEKNRAVRINVYGSVPAGVPLEAIQDIVDWEEIPADWLSSGQEYIGLKVKGDSMFPKYVEGDTVIVKLQPDCESGQDCIVYVNGYDATLKKVIKKTDCIILQPINVTCHEPKVYDYNDADHPITILGVVVQIRRDV